MNEKPGTITLRLSATPLNAVIELSDSGSGFDPAHLPHLFQPFFSTKPRGLGLNLAKAHRIVQKHGGTLTLAPNTPHGCTATVSLPLSACRETA